MTAVAARAPTASLFGHPRGLAVLAGTELAERFSYYGMTALLVLYMVKQLLLPGHAEHVLGLAALRGLFEFRGPMSDQGFASLIYGWYTGLVYFTPLLGGALADRWLGARRTVMLGAVLMAGGHIAMSFDQSFLIALVLLICGSGCLKGNIAAQVAPLYARDDESNRAKGFTIFSTGINIGATAGPLVTGILAQSYGWHVGFACAAVLMMVALFIYASGQSLLKGKASAIAKSAGPADPMSSDDRRRLLALLLLILINVPIAIAYYQIANVGVVWVDRWVDLATPLGPIPASWFVALDPLASILVAIPLIKLWTAQAKRGREPDSLGKVLQGALINAVSPLFFAAGILLAGPDAKVAVGWVLVGWSLFGVAFMYYWPLSLGLIAARAPERFRSTMMGGCYIALFLGNVALGWVGSFYEALGPLNFWLLDSAIAFVSVLAMIASMRWMRRVLG